MLLQVGSVNNTFGIKGVDQYCNFFKCAGSARLPLPACCCMP